MYVMMNSDKRPLLFHISLKHSFNQRQIFTQRAISRTYEHIKICMFIKTEDLIKWTHLESSLVKISCDGIPILRS